MGTMKTAKRRGRKQISSNAFFCFSRMLCIRLAAFCRRARGASVPQPIGNIAIVFRKQIAVCHNKQRKIVC
ncbi:MAG: hypothetical protein IJN44_01480 [Clostridia bacterium]|nr:hypothetical protein [Clostridia bacterium]